jgi:hypothetical protein
MKPENEIHESFCTVYAEAVIRFVSSGVNEDVTFDSSSQRFIANAVKAGTAPASCDWWVGDDWPTFVGPLLCPISPRHPKYSDAILKRSIIFALKKSATGKRMSHILAGLD